MFPEEIEAVFKEYAKENSIVVNKENFNSWFQLV